VDQHDKPPPFTIGIFTMGDLIALASVIFFSGALWIRVGTLERDSQMHEAQSRDEASRITNRVQTLEQVIPSGYVRRDEYREDAREIKAALARIEVELKTKVDK
jgi:hypothetical protein